MGILAEKLDPDSGIKMPEDLTGKEWKEDEVDRLFPKLAKKFG